MLKIMVLIFSLLHVSVALACLGPDAEVAQERHASVLFEGKPTAYDLNRSGPVEGVTSGAVAKVDFEVTKTIRGENRKRWSVIMRGHTLPKSFPEFKKRFGTVMQAGLRDFKIDPTKLPKGYEGLLFIVDSACSMNGEDWLLRKIQQK